GRLRLPVSSLGRDLVIARILGAFVAEYPDISLEAAVNNETGDLNEGEDAGIRGFSLIPQDMITVRLTPTGRQVAVAAPDYIARCGAPRTPAELSEHRCVQFRHPSGAA